MECFKSAGEHRYSVFPIFFFYLFPVSLLSARFVFGTFLGDSNSLNYERSIALPMKFEKLNDIVRMLKIIQIKVIKNVPTYCTYSKVLQML